MKLFADGEEVAQVSELNIHMFSILLGTNGILDVLVARSDTDGVPLTVRPLKHAEDAAVFRTLNQEWSARHFVIEEQDRRQLEDPVAAHIDTGGEILIAEWAGRPVGCVALVPDGNGCV